MPPIEEDLKHVKDVMDAWGANMKAGNGALLTDEFKDVFDKAYRFRTANMIAENHREAGMLTGLIEAEVEATRQAFADA